MSGLSEMTSRAAGPLGLRRAAFAAVLAVCALARAQEPAAPLPGINKLQEAKAAIAANQQLSEDARAAASTAYDNAIRAAQQAVDFQKQATDVVKRRDAAPDTDKKLHADLDKLKDAAPVALKKGATLADVEPLLSQAESDYKDAQAEFDAALSEPDKRAQRRKDLPALQEAARQREQNALAEYNAPIAQDEPQEVYDAEHLAAQAELEAARAELALMDAEASAFDVLNSLVSVRQDVAKARLGKCERDLKVLQEEAGRLRREEAAAAARKAVEDVLKVQGTNPQVQEIVMKLATDNESLALERTGEDGLAKKIEDATALAQAETARLAALREQWNNVKQRVNAGGFSDTVGVMLRKQRAELPNVTELENAIRQREGQAAAIELKQSEKRQQRLALADEYEKLNQMLAQPLAKMSQYEKQRVQATVKKFIDDQRGLIDALNADYFRYLTQLEDANRADKELAKISREFGGYISENILWIRGQPPFSMHTFSDIRAALAWLVDPNVWKRVPGLLRSDAINNALVFVPEALAALILLGLRRILRVRLQAIGAVAKGRRETHFFHTLRALFNTFLIALAWPGMLCFLASRLDAASDSLEQVDAVAIGLFAAAWVWAILEFMRALFVPGGLADAHFDWSIAAEGKALRRTIAIAALVGLPAVATTSALLSYADDTFSRSLGCLAHLIVLATIAVGAARAAALCHRAIRADEPEHWFADDSYRGALARWFVPGLQVFLAGMALFGYYYTSVEIGARAFQSLLVLIAAGVLSGIVRRWLLLARRRIAVEQARRKREAMRAEAEGEKIEPADEHALDIVKVDLQSQATIRIVTVLAVAVTLWFIWVDVVPALNILQQVRLWDTVGQVEVQNVAADGTVKRAMEERIQSITLANLVLALAVLVVSALAVRNLPGLIEIGLLQRLKMPKGERYATLAVVRYALIALGIVLAFQAIGIGWAKVQWLIAALSVGVGFGMQEIIANFISGLILLFERPIRVGDIVTVGGTSGTVAEIRIRATTITDFNNKDYIVPNKEFITGHLLNWSLTSPSVRVVIPVGVAYGADLQQALKLLLDAALQHPKVLREPAPSVQCTGFGDSAVNIELRCYSQDIDSAGPIKHDLHLRIHADFAAAGIEIPFPQREVRMRTN